jgi:hypothetical protein
MTGLREAADYAARTLDRWLCGDEDFTEATVREAISRVRAALAADDGEQRLWVALERFVEELERDCSPLAQDPENSIDYGEGICDERGRIAGILDSLLSPEADAAFKAAYQQWHDGAIK